MKKRLERLLGLAAAIGKWIICKDDATDEEKETLIDRARLSPTDVAHACLTSPVLTNAGLQTTQAV